MVILEHICGLLPTPTSIRVDYIIIKTYGKLRIQLKLCLIRLKQFKLKVLVRLLVLWTRFKSSGLGPNPYLKSVSALCRAINYAIAYPKNNNRAGDLE